MSKLTASFRIIRDENTDSPSIRRVRSGMNGSLLRTGLVYHERFLWCDLDLRDR